MQAKVIRTFRDKHTSERHVAGSVIEVSEERYAEILTAGKFVEAVAVKEPAMNAPEEGEDGEAPKPAKRARKAKK